MNIQLSQNLKIIWELTQNINSTWYRGNPLNLNGFFHPNVVFNNPDFKHQITGKEECIKTYIDFLTISEIELYNEHNPIVQLYTNTAIVTYDFEMKYKQNQKLHHETGTDIMVFESLNNLWLLVWRGMSNLRNT